MSELAREMMAKIEGGIRLESAQEMTDEYRETLLHLLTMQADADIGTARITSDKRVNIFYYPIETWADFVFFNFCMDRGAGHQLEDVRGCSYGPWARAIEGIFKEEKFHIRHGEYWVKKLADDPATRDEAQTTFAKWYIRTMNIFGRPGSPKNALYRRYRLKTRDNDEV